MINLIYKVLNKWQDISFHYEKSSTLIQFFPIEFDQIEKELANFHFNCPYIDPQEATIRNRDRVPPYIISYGCKLAQHSSNLVYVQLVFLLMLSRASFSLEKIIQGLSSIRDI